MGYVYFITYENDIYRHKNPFLKIGNAKDVYSRLSALQTGSPVKLALAGFIEIDDALTLEQYFLRQFKANRVKGEWIKITKGIINFIRSYKLNMDCFNELFPDVFVDERDVKIAALEKEIEILRELNKKHLEKMNEMHHTIKMLDPRKKKTNRNMRSWSAWSLQTFEGVEP